jgi:hypothetical protein
MPLLSGLKKKNLISLDGFLFTLDALKQYFAMESLIMKRH